MTPDLTPQIDEQLDRMERLLAALKKQGKKPITEKLPRTLYETAITSLEECKELDPVEAEEARKVLKLPAPTEPKTQPFRPTTFLRRLAGH